MQKTNNNNNVLLRVHIKQKKCTESLLNGDYSVKLSDRGRRKIDSKESSSLSQELPSHVHRSWCALCLGKAALHAMGLRRSLFSAR